MKTATGVTLITNGRLVDGNGGRARARRGGRGPRRRDRLRRPGRRGAGGPARRRPDRRAGRDDHAGPGRGPFPPDLLQRRRAGRPRHQVPGRVRHDPLAAANARLALECGYTAARSGGSLHNIDVWLKKAIEEDLVPGPRLAASGREICGAGGLMDWNPDHLKLGMEGLILLINGPDEGRAAVRKLVKDGVEWIKTYPTGDAAAPDAADHHTLCMTFEEMAAVVAEAHNYRRKVTGHCRATQGIKNALRAGFDTHRARHVHGRRGARPAAGARRARASRPCSSSRRASSAGPSSACRQAVIDGHKETLDGGRRERPDDPPGRRPARHGGRLRVRLEPARRLRQGAHVLRPRRRLHARWRRSPAPPGPAPRSWAAADEFGTVEPASSPTCSSSTATSWPTSPCSKTARGSSPSCRGASSRRASSPPPLRRGDRPARRFISRAGARAPPAVDRRAGTSRGSIAAAGRRRARRRTRRSRHRSRSRCPIVRGRRP